MLLIGRDSFPGGAARLQIWQGPSVGSWWVRLPLFSANDLRRLHIRFILQNNERACHNTLNLRTLTAT